MNTKRLPRILGSIVLLGVLLTAYGVGAEPPLAEAPAPVVIQRTPERGEAFHVPNEMEG